MGRGKRHALVTESPRGRLDRTLLELATLPLGQPTPDAEPLVVGQGVLQALGPDLAADADLLGLPRRPALLREERLGVRLGTERTLLPRHLHLFATLEGDQLKLLHGFLLDPVRRHVTKLCDATAVTSAITLLR